MGDCVWPQVNRAIIALPGIGQGVGVSSPDKLILISCILMGPKASSLSETSRVPCPFWDFFVLNGCEQA